MTADEIADKITKALDTFSKSVETATLQLQQNIESKSSTESGNKHSHKKSYKASPRITRGGVHFENDQLTGIDPDVRTAVIRQDISEIVENAFNQGTNLESIEFLGRISTISPRAFACLPALRSIRFHKPVGTIGQHAFIGCEALRSIDFLSDLAMIDIGAFARCASLEDIHFHGNLSEINEFAFHECTALRTISIPDSCEYIGEGCFAECISLEHVHLPLHLRVIRSGTFASCISLKTVDWPETVVIDKHDYPCLHENAFLYTLTDLYWETFQLQPDGILRRTPVIARDADPDGFFSLVEPGNGGMVHFVPQLITNSILNELWEKTGPDEPYYQFMMATFTTAAEITARLSVSSLQADHPEDRAELLAVFNIVRNCLSFFTRNTRQHPELSLAFALSAAFFALGATGFYRQTHDDIVAKLARSYFTDGNSYDAEQINQDIRKAATAKKEHANSANEPDYDNPVMKDICRLLRFGPDVPFRYDPYNFRSLVIREPEKIDYYHFVHALDFLMRNKFGCQLNYGDDDLSSDEPEVWYTYWGSRIYSQISRDLVLTVFSAQRIFDDHNLEGFARSMDKHTIRDLFRHFAGMDFVTVLRKDEAEEISTIFHENHIEGMMACYHFSCYEQVDG